MRVFINIKKFLSFFVFKDIDYIDIPSSKGGRNPNPQPQNKPSFKPKGQSGKKTKKGKRNAICAASNDINTLYQKGNTYYADKLTNGVLDD